MPPQREWLEAVLFSMSDLVLVIDERLVLTFVNSAAESRLAAQKNQNIAGLLVPLMAGSEPNVWLGQCFATGLPFEFDIQRDDRTYTCVASPLSAQEPGWVLVLRETTRFKKSEVVKSRMIRMLSHDLKNPLTAISGITQMLLRKMDQVNSGTHDALHKITANVQRMEHLINGVVDLQHVESGLITLHMVEVRWLFNRLMAEFGERARTKQQAFRLAVPEDKRLIVSADERLLYQAFSNLIDNAIKYTPEDGCINIAVGERDSKLLVEVHDEGYGIPLALQGRLFEQFYRARSLKTVDVPGNGIGLSLVKAVVERHGGRIWFESEEDQGSTFYVELPLVMDAAHQ